MKIFLYNLGIVALPLALIWIIAVPVYNYTLDPYGLLSKVHHNYNTEPNMRTLKREYVSSIENNYPLLLFSNSRGGVYNIHDKGFYNMSYSMGLPEEFLDDIKYILSRNSSVDSVIIFIDETSIFNDVQTHFNQPLRKVYNLNDYFSILTIPFSLKKFKSFLYKRHRSIQFFLDIDGHYEYYGFDHVRNRMDTINFNITTDCRGDIDKAKTAWLSLTDFLKSNGIGFGLFIHPLSESSVDRQPFLLGDLNRLISSLKEEGLVFQNEVVVMESDSACFYDASHYTPDLANYIFSMKKPTNISADGFRLKQSSSSRQDHIGQ